MSVGLDRLAGLDLGDNDSLVGLLSYWGISLLFTGDVDKVVEESIGERMVVGNSQQ